MTVRQLSRSFIACLIALALPSALPQFAHSADEAKPTLPSSIERAAAEATLERARKARATAEADYIQGKATKAPLESAIRRVAQAEKQLKELNAQIAASGEAESPGTFAADTGDSATAEKLKLLHAARMAAEQAVQKAGREVKATEEAFPQGKITKDLVDNAKRRFKEAEAKLGAIDQELAMVLTLSARALAGKQ